MQLFQRQNNTLSGYHQPDSLPVSVDVTRAVAHSVKQVCYLLLAPPAASLQLVISWKYFKGPGGKMWT